MTVKRLMLAIALWGVGGPVSAAEPALEGNIGLLHKALDPIIVGVEAEVGLKGGPWHVGGLFQMERFERQTGTAEGGYVWHVPHIAAGWARYDWALPNGDAIGPVAGLSYSPTTQYIGQPTTDVLSATGAVVGAAYTLRSGPLWLRAMPHVVIGAPRPNDFFLFRSGMPWLEFGWTIVPGLQASARLSEAFFKLAWVF